MSVTSRVRRSPVAVLWWWPARLSPLVVLPLLVYLVLWAFTADSAGWGYVMFPLVTIGLVVTVGFGLYLGLLAALALRAWPERSRVAATVTALGSVLPVATLGATADSTTQRALWAGLALVVAGVVGAVTLADARRIARPGPR